MTTPCQSDIYEFFYVHDDVHFLNIKCKEISPSEHANSSLLKISSNVYKFHNKQTRKSYEISREFVCLSMIANLFNQTFFNLDSKLSSQQQIRFSEDDEIQFESHIKKFLIERIFSENEDTDTFHQNDNNQGNNNFWESWENNCVHNKVTIIKKLKS